MAGQGLKRRGLGVQFQLDQAARRLGRRPLAFLGPRRRPPWRLGNLCDGCAVILGNLFARHYAHAAAVPRRKIQHVGESDFCVFLQDPFSTDVKATGAGGLAFADGLRNPTITYQSRADLAGVLGRVAGPDCRLRCVEVFQVLVDETLLQRLPCHAWLRPLRFSK